MGVGNNYLIMNNGVKIPQLGLGTYKNSDDPVTVASVYHAIKIGYRQIDTAAIYLNEREVGQAIKQAIEEGIVKREDLFIVTKLWGTQHRMVETAIKQSLERLGLDYVDLYLMHWPFPFNARTIKPSDPLNYLVFPKNPDHPELYDEDPGWSFVDTYKDMQKLVGKGYTRSIGISNFTIKRMTKLLDDPSTKILPVAIQVEVQPLFPQKELMEFCKRYGILVQAYAPMGSWKSSDLLVNPTLVRIAKKLNIDVAQVCISWGLQRGEIVIPKSSKIERVTRNFKDLVKLSAEDFEAINNMPKEYGEQRMILANNFPPFVLFE